MAVFGGEDIQYLEKRLNALPTANLSAAQLTQYLYVRALIDRLYQRAQGQQSLLVTLVQKSDHALNELEASLKKQHHEAEKQLTIIEEDYEGHIDRAKSFLETHAYAELTRLFKTVNHRKASSLFKELINEIGAAELNVPDTESVERVSHKSPKKQLQSFQQYQTMFEKMALDRLLSKVMKEIPENAGPLNPERLVIRSFKALQDISPDYLSHLISYYESLLSLQLLQDSNK